MPRLDTIAGRLEHARALRRLGSRELSLLAGLSSGAVHAIESDPAADPKVSTLRALAAALGADPAWLALGHGAPPVETAADRARLPPGSGRPRQTGGAADAPENRLPEWSDTMNEEIRGLIARGRLAAERVETALGGIASADPAAVEQRATDALCSAAEARFALDELERAVDPARAGEAAGRFERVGDITMQSKPTRRAK